MSLSVGQSSENSNSFYTSIISYNYDWITPQYNTLWNSGTDDNPVKTEYDPCPEGWRVPTYAELDNLRLNKSSWTANNGQNGYWFSGSNSYSEFVYRVFFPAAGFRQYDGEISERGVDGNYWSSRPDSDWTNYLNFYSSKVQIISCRRACGLSVRCVQE